jgi:D-beta-D-heptose 7-phosphate kinase/D-beta-D-heptose 1-phosphate adenosyltransferase
MSQLLEALARWKPFHAIVLGDFMLDETCSGDADRLANDAPVPVLLVKHTEQRPGGAANVCLDLIALKGSVAAVGLVGADHAGQRLRELLTTHRVESRSVLEDASRPTTVKRSIIGLAQHRHAQKMFRLDYESREPATADITRQLIAAFERELQIALTLKLPIVVCIEDYNKGVCTPELCRQVIALCHHHAIEVLVDPAPLADYAKYRGATTITPNRAESETASRGTGPEPSRPPARHRARTEDYADIAQHLLTSLDLAAAVITLDKSGALLLERDAEAQAVPTTARTIYDVTGAGDMVLAALAGARANAINWFDAVRFANAAAGLEVEEFGCVPIPLERIHRDLLRREKSEHSKLRTLDQLRIEIDALRHTTTPAGARPSVVFTNGCFDLLHLGHVSTLQRAAELGDFLVVAINDDPSVRKLKGPGRPVRDQDERAGVIAALECVGAVIIFSEDTPQRLIEAITPDILVKGAQYDEDSIPGAAHVKAHGGRVVLVDVIPGRSTTNTVDKIRATPKQ